MIDSVTQFDDAIIPRFPRGVRLRHDEIRGEWILLAPERLIKCDPIAAAILQEIDGVTTLGAITRVLSMRYKADADIIARDVLALLINLRDKNMVVL